MKLSVVIVSYNVKELLLQCLASLFAGFPQEQLQVIVVDNDSKDGSLLAVKEKFPQVELVANDFNNGFSGGNNQGLLLCKGEFILLLNPDTEIKPGALEKMIARLQEEKQPAILGPKLLNSDGTLQGSAWKLPGVWAMLAEALFISKIFPSGQYAPEQFEKEFSPGFLSGAALLFTKTTQGKTGTLDRALFWMEDVDYCLRVQEKGGRTIYFPQAEIIHHSGQSARKNYRIAISNQLLSKLKYFRKHSGIAACVAASFFAFLQIILRIPVFLLLAPFGESYRARFTAYLYTLKKLITYIFAGDRRVT
ncbi:MAG: family 2 glycosyl transferase [Bacteroidetes bacterium]|nr:MAG: family 2 glycosyl transferase [Bacteroidota bacterium]